MMKSGQEGDEVRRARGKGMTGEGWRDAGVQRGSEAAGKVRSK